MRAFLVSAGLITLTAMVCFTLGLRSAPPPTQPPCEAIPVGSPDRAPQSSWRAI